MTSAYWAWGAVLADLVLFFGPLPLSTTTTAFVAIWVVHGIVCAILATSSLLFVPPKNREALPSTWALFFCFALIAPVVGALSIVLITRTTLRRALDHHLHAKPRSVELPEFEVRARKPVRAGQGAIRSRLMHDVPAKVRMQSLLTLQAVPGRVANPILEELLGDDCDDVRMVAFGMLEAKEKKLSGRIHEGKRNLDHSLSKHARYDCLRHLAELHWELTYAGLVQGGLVAHNLNQAWKYIEEALSMDEKHESGIWFLKGRILLAQGAMEPARQALEESMQMGQSQSSVLPYLSELAFQKRDFTQVHTYMRALGPLHATARTQAIVDFWSGRENVLHFRDRRILQHI